MLGGRTAWLGRPWFILAVLLLALNDHVLKENWPGWFTGKLSDFAGLVIIGTLLSILVGPTWGLLAAGLGFIALKTFPGVAEVVAPILGGVTLRDPTDLIALAALPPLWWQLHRTHPGQAARNRRGWQAIGLVAAVLATTATSNPPPRYLELGSAAGAIHASVDPGDGLPPSYLRSSDGGQTWSRTNDQSDIEKVTWVSSSWDDAAGCPNDACQRYGVDENLKVCAADGVCYRIRSDGNYGSIIERRTPGSKWLPDGVSDQSYDQLVIDPSDSDHVATGSETARTVVFRKGANNWAAQDLGPLSATQLERSSSQFYLAIGSQEGSVVIFFIVLFGSIRFVPWLAARVALIVIASLIGGAGAFLGWFFPFSGLNLGWLVIATLLIGAMQLSYRAERRRLADTTPPSDLR